MQLSKDKKISECSQVPPMRLELTVEKHKLDTFIVNQIYKAASSKQDIMGEHYGST